MSKYFYARVSTKSQNLDRQLEVAKEYQCDKIFTDKESGKNFDRKSYLEMKSIVTKGDEVFVKELDRLGRNKEQIKEEIEWFKNHGVYLRILNVPTTLINFNGQDWIGDMVNNILIEVMSAMAEQERVKIKERQREGIDLALARGVHFGNKAFEGKIDKPKDESVSSYCKRMNISRSTYYKYVN